MSLSRGTGLAPLSEGQAFVTAMAAVVVMRAEVIVRVRMLAVELADGTSKWVSSSFRRRASLLRPTNVCFALVSNAPSASRLVARLPVRHLGRSHAHHCAELPACSKPLSAHAMLEQLSERVHTRLVAPPGRRFAWPWKRPPQPVPADLTPKPGKLNPTLQVAHDDRAEAGDQILADLKSDYRLLQGKTNHRQVEAVELLVGLAGPGMLALEDYQTGRTCN